MKPIKIYPLKKSISSAIQVPGSLSYTIRALTIAAMIEGSIKIINPVKSTDSYTMIEILKTLGIKIEEGKDCFIVHGNIHDIQNKDYYLDVNISGRTARSALALLTIVPGIKTLICSKEFKKRPVKDLVEGLQQLGATIEYVGEKGYLPVKILSNRLHSGTVKMKGSVSSQYFSALMMIAPLVGKIIIEVLEEQVSKSFIDITIDIMKAFGVEVENKNYKKYVIKNGQKYLYRKTYLVEADATAASYFLAIAALTKSEIKVLHLNPDSKQGDVHFSDILKKMGCFVKKDYKQSSITIQGKESLHGIVVNMNSTPDIVPTLAVVAAFAKGNTKMSGLSHLKLKESDRILGPKTELQKMGIQADATDDTLTVCEGPIHSACIDTYGDHRMAMAFAVAGTKLAEGIIIKNPEVVNKSFPDFWKILEKIGIRLERIYE